MTELNIEQHKIKHQYNPPSIGTYNPNYDSIYKKAKATIILENHEDKRNKRDKFEVYLKDSILQSFNHYAPMQLHKCSRR